MYFPISYQSAVEIKDTAMENSTNFFLMLLVLQICRQFTKCADAHRKDCFLPPHLLCALQSITLL